MRGGPVGLGSPALLHRLDARLLGRVVPLLRLLRPPRTRLLLGPLGPRAAGSTLLLVLLLLIWLILPGPLTTGCGGEAETVVTVLTRNPLVTVV
ncbi:hypothetical protein IX27_35690 [Streptomyces sp. JS01]|nr:hypothetical protein IX27_35690 [Streptomyces sp. JS01]